MPPGCACSIQAARFAAEHRQGRAPRPGRTRRPLRAMEMRMPSAATTTSGPVPGGRAAVCEYLDYSGRDDVFGGGVRMLPVDTHAGRFRVWTKRIGNNPQLRMLLLHGGPGATHSTSKPATVSS